MRGLVLMLLIINLFSSTISIDFGKFVTDIAVNIFRDTSVSRDPNQIRYSQEYVTGPSRLDELERSMRNEGFKTGSEIDVVMMPDGRLTSLDNRRLLAARRANVLVKVNLHQYDDPLPTGFNRVYIPPYGERTWGSAIEWRILSQPSVVFRQQYPYGCIDDPYVKGVKGNKKTDKIIEDDSYDWPFHHDEN